jgi:hypothetical protein
MRKRRIAHKASPISDEHRAAVIDDLQTAVDWIRAEFVGVNPEWRPLEKLLPPEWWSGWMFMERHGDICCYKHGITRRHLNIDPEGRCYVYMGSRKGWREVDAELAIDVAYENIEKLGETRESKYDDAYRARKYAAFAEMGITVIR